MAFSKKFKLKGGRAGSITFVEGGASGRLDWEMLVGDVAMVIYPESCRWLTPDNAPITPDDVCRLAQELAIEGKFAVEIALAEGSQVVWPSAAAQLAADRAFYDLLGPELAEQTCRRPNCRRGAISQSVFCRSHHFESIRGRPCPFE